VSFFRQTLMVLRDNFHIKCGQCDSGFYEIGFNRYLESNRFTYSISVPISQKIKCEILKVMQWSTMSKEVEVGTFVFQHCAQKCRIYVMVRQSISRKQKVSDKQQSLFKDLKDWSQYRISVMITNNSELPPEDIWNHYRPCTNDKNVVKDVKKRYLFDSFNVQNFWALEAILILIALVFHNLVVYLNRTILNHNRLQDQLKTSRIRHFTFHKLIYCFKFEFPLFTGRDGFRVELYPA